MKIFSRKVLVVSAFAASAAFAYDPFWNDKIWTTWHLEKTWVQGLLALAKMRENLNRFNLHDAYSRPLNDAVDCGPDYWKYWRQNDGTCNDEADAWMGAANTRFSRNVRDPQKVTPKQVDEWALVNDPNPLVVSRRLLSRPQTDPNDDSYIRNPSVNMLAAAWIQFENHDWFSHGDNIDNYAIASPWHLVDDNRDGRRGPLDLSEMFVPRTAIDETRQRDDPGYPTFRNEVTHWWDGSQVYGSDRAAIDCGTPASTRLRACQRGHLTLAGGGVLPVDAGSGKEITGFNRNWWVGLTVLHTLFARNHNTIADDLARAHPDWNDEKLFHTARLINVAMMAKIHTVEWTPGILANPWLDRAMKSNWYGALTSLTKGKKANSWMDRIIHHHPLLSANTKALLGGLVGGKKNLHGKAYSLTEEFTAVYRLHSLLPENIEMRPRGGGVERLPIQETRERKAHGVRDRYGFDALFESLGAQNAGALVIGNYPRFLRNVDIEVPVAGRHLRFDMGAVDILRDRERGVPRYNRFREQLGLKPIVQFEDLMPLKPHRGKHGWVVTEADAARNRDFVERMKEVYFGDVEKIDLLTGTLAESYRPEGYGFGETMFQVFVLMASRRLQADRFFTTDYNHWVYSHEGLKMIDESTLKSILVRNFPSLDPNLIPDNAFAPWKTR